MSSSRQARHFGGARNNFDQIYANAKAIEDKQKRVRLTISWPNDENPKVIYECYGDGEPASLQLISKVSDEELLEVLQVAHKAWNDERIEITTKEMKKRGISFPNEKEGK